MISGGNEHAPLRDEGVEGLVAAVPRQLGHDLRLEGETDGRKRAAAQEPVVVSAAVTEPVPVGGKRETGHDHDVRAGRGNLRARTGLRYPEGPGNKAAEAPYRDEFHVAGTGDARQDHGPSLPQGPAHERARVDLAPDREICEDHAGVPPRRKAHEPRRCHPAPHRLYRAETVLPEGEHLCPQMPLEFVLFPHRRRHSNTAALVALLLVPVLLLSGCLPLLLGNARVLKTGELTISAAGMARTRAVPAEVRQPGSSGVVEFRGGLPGDRMDAGLTIHAPWTATWDLKYMFRDEGEGFAPAVAARVRLGMIQPAYGGSLLVSRRFGPLELVASGGGGRSSERIWLPGATTLGNGSESFVKDYWAWGGGFSYNFASPWAFFAEAVYLSPAKQREIPRLGEKAFEVSEKPSVFLAGGMRFTIVIPRQKRTEGIIALRGHVLAVASRDRFEVGQPGVYRATVLVDAYTQVLRMGKPGTLDDLAPGKPVLIQGIPLPKPSTFLARVIEIQSP